MKYRIIRACNYKKGKCRDNNEDNDFFDGNYVSENTNDISSVLNISFTSHDHESFAIFDGVGGEASGEKASFLAAKTLKEYKGAHDVVDNMSYIIKANDKIVNYDGIKNMATTLCLINFNENDINVCNLGDSRIYLLRDGNLKMISVDHTDENISKKLNVLEKSKPRLMQYLGVDSDELSLEPTINTFEYKVGDRYLLCTDGLTDFVSNADIQDVMRTGSCARDIVDRLMRLAQENKTKDNTTIQVFEVKRYNKIPWIVGLMILSFIIIISILFFTTRFSIKDECSSLVEGDSCEFKFNNSKYDIEINDENIIEYKNNRLYAINSGTTEIKISKNNKMVYSKEVKVFPNS